MFEISRVDCISRAVIRQHSSPEPVLAHHEHKVLNSKYLELTVYQELSPDSIARLNQCLPIRVDCISRAVTRQHSSPEPVLAHHEHKVLNSKSIRKVMLLPYNTLKQSEYNLPFRHINKSMTLTSDIKLN